MPPTHTPFQPFITDNFQLAAVVIFWQIKQKKLNKSTAVCPNGE